MFDHLKTLRPDPHDPEIRELIKERWGNFTEEIQAEIGHLEQEYTKWQHRSIIGVAVGFVGLVLLYGIDEESVIGLLYNKFGISDDLRLLLFLLGLMLLTASVFLLAPWFKLRNEFNLASNPIIYRKIFQILDLDATHNSNLPSSNLKIIAELDNSGLITRLNNNYTFDDKIFAKYKGQDLLIAELGVNHFGACEKNS